MPDLGTSAKPVRAEEPSPEEFGHPRGTLAIVILFGVLFALAWFAMYIFEFLQRGAPHS